MTSKRPKQRHGPNERDRLIVDHVTRYRLTTLDAIRRVVLQFGTLVAAGEAKSVPLAELIITQIFCERRGILGSRREEFRVRARSFSSQVRRRICG